MSRVKMIILAAFVLVLTAGVVVGRLWARSSPMHQPSWLVDQLNLTPTQQQQMDEIWSDTKQKLSKTFDHRRALDKDREQAVRNILSTDQQAAYDKILADFRNQRAEMEKDREKLIHDADERSRALLNPEQLKKWEQMRSNRDWHGHGPATQRLSSTKPSGIGSEK